MTDRRFNFLQVWLNDSIPAELKECMDSVLRQVGQNDRYILLAKHNFMGDDPKITFFDLKDYETVIEGYEGLHPAVQSDIYRLFFAINIDDLVYVDSDVYLHSFDRSVNRLTFANYSKEKSDIYYFYSNSDINFFKEYLRRFKQNIDDCMKKYPVTGTLADLTRSWEFNTGYCDMKEHSNFDSSTYIHHRFSSVHKGEFKSYG